MTTSAVSRSLRRLRRDERGVTAMIVALTLPLLLAFGALAINSGLWFTIKRENQSAADAAALSAAYELMAGSAMAGSANACTDPNLPNFVADRLAPAAAQAVAANQHTGWDTTVTNTTVTCPYPPDTLLDTEFGAGSYQAVAVTLEQVQSSLFAFAPLTSATIKTRSIGVVANAQDVCLLALGQSLLPSGSCPAGFGICGNGSGSLTTPGCAVVANSTASNAIDLDGGANITAGAIVTAGGVAGSGGVGATHPTAQTYATTVPDPYAPDALGNCANPPCLTHAFLTTGMPPPPCVTVDGPLDPTKRRICGGSKVSGTVPPGRYWITDGDLSVSGTLNGAGVTIIFTTSGAGGTIGTINMLSPSAQITGLNAPSSGTDAGLLFVQDTEGINYSTIGFLGRGLGFDGNGLIYFPHTDLEFQGNPTLGASGCMILVANSVTLKGTSQLSSTGCAGAGLNKTPTVKTVVLGE
jgi:Flp pilus assembly protein TadG